MLMKLLLKNNSTRPRDPCVGNMWPVGHVSSSPVNRPDH